MRKIHPVRMNVSYVEKRNCSITCKSPCYSEKRNCSITCKNTSSTSKETVRILAVVKYEAILCNSTKVKLELPMLIGQCKYSNVSNSYSPTVEVEQNN